MVGAQDVGSADVSRPEDRREAGAEVAIEHRRAAQEQNDIRSAAHCTVCPKRTSP
jgi:hypothetical protein